MSNTDAFERELIFVFDGKDKKFIYFGIIAKMMESLLCIENEWLTSVRLKKQIYTFEDQKVVFVEIESENDLGLK